MNNCAYHFGRHGILFISSVIVIHDRQAEHLCGLGHCDGAGLGYDDDLGYDDGLDYGDDDGRLAYSSR